MTQIQKETVGSFINKVLSGTAIAIVVALIPNAILATLLKQLPTHPLLVTFQQVLTYFQFFTPIMAGFLIAQQFKLNPMQQIAVGGAAYIGSGAIGFIELYNKAGDAVKVFKFNGIGDLINMMITAALAVLVVQWIGNKLGSLNIVFLPILVGTLVGFIGLQCLPYVSKITTWIGQIINTFTTLQPLLMSVLISMSFALLIVSPISTVAIGIAIGLNGISAGAASMGLAATAAVLVWATARVNKAGVPLAVGLGAMKMMMPNFLRKPIIGVPMVLTAAVSALTIPYLNLIGTPQSSGFGLVGLVGPIASLEGGSGPILIFLAWIVVPFAVAFFANKLCCDVLKLYDAKDFEFKG